MQPHEVKFRWRSFKSAFSSLFVLCSALTMLFSLKSQLDLGPLSPTNIIGTIFFGTCTIICILFFSISQKWRSLMMRWSNIEVKFFCKKYELPTTRWKLKKRILVFLIASLLIALFEHLLSLADKINNLSFEVTHCNITNYNFFELFIVKHFGFVTKNIPLSYSNFIGLIAEYLNVSFTFYWNFLDIFSILISIGVSDLFERLNHRMKSHKTVHIDETTW